jgi:hypothetical protein
MATLGKTDIGSLTALVNANGDRYTGSAFQYTESAPGSVSKVTGYVYVDANTTNIRAGILENTTDPMEGGALTTCTVLAQSTDTKSIDTTPGWHELNFSNTILTPNNWYLPVIQWEDEGLYCRRDVDTLNHVLVQDSYADGIQAPGSGFIYNFEMSIYITYTTVGIQKVNDVNQFNRISGV